MDNLLKGHNWRAVGPLAGRCGIPVGMEYASLAAQCCKYRQKWLLRRRHRPTLFQPRPNCPWFM